MLLPVLDKDETWKEHKDKLFEESTELLDELTVIDVGNIVAESFDVIQVCIGILDKAETEHPGITKRISNEHIAKLINKGFRFKSVLRVEED